MLAIEDVPAEPGSYALHLTLSDAVCLAIGRLGTFTFPAGDYIYLGSARGPGGLRARLRHHARGEGRPHWHLDYLRPHAVLRGGWYTTGVAALECAWSQALAGLPGGVITAPGFGAADCRGGCPAHLIAFLGSGGVERVGASLRGMGILVESFGITHPESGKKVE